MIKLGYSIMMDVGLKNMFSWLTIEKLPNTFKIYIYMFSFLGPLGKKLHQYLSICLKAIDLSLSMLYS